MVFNRTCLRESGSGVSKVSKRSVPPVLVVLLSPWAFAHSTTNRRCILRMRTASTVSPLHSSLSSCPGLATNCLSTNTTHSYTNTHPGERQFAKSGCFYRFGTDPFTPKQRNAVALCAGLEQRGQRKQEMRVFRSELCWFSQKCVSSFRGPLSPVQRLVMTMVRWWEGGKGCRSRRSGVWPDGIAWDSSSMVCRGQEIAADGVAHVPMCNSLSSKVHEASLSRASWTLLQLPLVNRSALARIYCLFLKRDWSCLVPLPDLYSPRRRGAQHAESPSDSISL